MPTKRLWPLLCLQKNRYSNGNCWRRIAVKNMVFTNFATSQLFLDFSYCMIGLCHLRAGDESRMTGDCCRPEGSILRCVCTHSPLYSYIYGLVALLDNIQSSFSSITISTGYEPGADYHLYYECSIYISRSRASKTLNHPLPSLFVTVATAAHKHTKTQHHHHCHHLHHTATTSAFTMFTETFKNDYRVFAKPTSFSSIAFPATSIYQSDTTSPSQTAYMSQYRTHQHTHLSSSKCTHYYTKLCHHHGIHSDNYKCTYHNSFTYNYQVPFEQETERKHTKCHLSRTDNCTHLLTNTPMIKTLRQPISHWAWRWQQSYSKPPCTR